MSLIFFIKETALSSSYFYTLSNLNPSKLRLQDKGNLYPDFLFHLSIKQYKWKLEQNVLPHPKTLYLR